VVPKAAARAVLVADVMLAALVERRAAAPAAAVPALDASGAGVAMDVVFVTIMTHLCAVAGGPAADGLPLLPTTTAAAVLVYAVAGASAVAVTPAVAAEPEALAVALRLAAAALPPVAATAAGLRVPQRALPPPPATCDGSGNHGANAPHDPPPAAVRCAASDVPPAGTPVAAAAASPPALGDLLPRCVRACRQRSPPTR